VVLTKEETMQDVSDSAPFITITEPVTEVTATDDGTFTYVADFATNFGKYSGVVEMELDGDLASRIEWLSLELITDS